MFKYIVAHFNNGSKKIFVFSGSLNHANIAYQQLGSKEHPSNSSLPYPELSAGFFNIEKSDNQYSYQGNFGNSISLKVGQNEIDNSLLNKHLNSDVIKTLIFDKNLLVFEQ